MIEPIHLVLVFTGLFLGFIIGWFIGRKLHELQRIKRVLRAKNPELWDLEHYVAVDEQETKQTSRTHRNG